jgi:hypothetical protein
MKGVLRIEGKMLHHLGATLPSSSFRELLAMKSLVNEVPPISLTPCIHGCAFRRTR